MFNKTSEIKILRVIFPVIFLVGLFLSFNTVYPGSVSAVIPRGCSICDAYGNCVQNRSGYCDPSGDECGTSSDCGGSGGIQPTPGPYPIDKCTYCDITGYCDQNPPPCSGYSCTVGSKCSPSNTPNTGDCPLNNGFPWCQQTNPSYAQTVLSGCNDKMYTYTCGQQVVSSVLCKYKGKCDVLDNINNDMGSIKCQKTINSDLQAILDRSQYDGSYTLNRATPDVVTSNDAYFSRDKLIALVQGGNQIVVSGWFKTEDGSRIAHHSLIVGVTSDGKLIFNDPYFNSNNPNPNDRVYTDTIEDVMDYVKITDAFVVDPNK